MLDQAPIESELRRECRVFCRYLVRQEPNDYVQEKYVAYHSRPDAEAARPADRFDRLLLRVSRRSRVTACVADSYASRFHRRSAVRKKLVLLLAILECCPPSFQYIDSPDRGGRAWIFATLFGRGVLFGVTLLVATIAFGPLHLISKLVAFRTPARRPGRRSPSK